MLQLNKVSAGISAKVLPGLRNSPELKSGKRLSVQRLAEKMHRA
jgi:hypothetical protein